MEKGGLIAEKTAQRFFPVLQKALSIGLESNFLKESFDYGLLNSGILQGFYFREPEKLAKTVSLKHPAQTNSKDLLNDLFFPVAADETPLTIKFQTLPDILQPLYQRINLFDKTQEFHNPDVLGLICGRFENNPPFKIQNREGAPYLNLDCYSKTKEWNPLFIKYCLNSPLETLRIGYLKVEVMKTSSGAIEAKISRVSEKETPEHLQKKTL